MEEIIAKSLDDADKSWTFLDGSKRSAVILGKTYVGRGEYLPGWRWSEHVGSQTGKEAEKHIGYILSGKMVISSADGKEVTVGPGEAFEVGAGHDAWVLGDEPCVAIDFGTI